MAALGDSHSASACKYGKEAPPVGVGVSPSSRVATPVIPSVDGVRPRRMSLPTALEPEFKRRKETVRLWTHGCEEPVETMERELCVVDAEVAVPEPGGRVDVPSMDQACWPSSGWAAVGCC